MSATSSRPALAAWTASPAPGFRITIVGSAMAAISISDWPTPTTQTRPGRHNAASNLIAAGTAAASPPRWPRRHDRTRTSESLRCAAIRSGRQAVLPRRKATTDRLRTATRNSRSRYALTRAPTVVAACARGAGHTDHPRNRYRAERIKHFAAPDFLPSSASDRPRGWTRRAPPR